MGRVGRRTGPERVRPLHSAWLFGIVEGYTPTNPNHLLYEATMEDPDVFARPWSLQMPLYRIVDEGAELLELNCVEISEEALYGDIRGLTLDDFDD